MGRPAVWCPYMRCAAAAAAAAVRRAMMLGGQKQVCTLFRTTYNQLVLRPSPAHVDLNRNRAALQLSQPSLVRAPTPCCVAAQVRTRVSSLASLSAGTAF